MPVKALRDTAAGAVLASVTVTLAVSQHAYFSVLMLLRHLPLPNLDFTSCRVSVSRTCTCSAHFIKYAPDVTCGLGTARYPTMHFMNKYVGRSITRLPNMVG